MVFKKKEEKKEEVKEVKVEVPKKSSLNYEYKEGTLNTIKDRITIQK